MNIVRTCVVLIAPLLLVACSSTKTVRVAVPPRVDLRPYPAIGLVTFTASNDDAELEEFATQRFLQAVQAAQPGTRVVELGSEREVFASVKGARSWNARTLRAIGETHGVDVILVGQLDIEKSKPKVNISSAWKSISARSDVNATLSARLIETGSGATVWTDSADVTATLAHGGFSGHGKGHGHFGAADPEEVYGEMVNGLVFAVTDDFRETYVLRKVPKDQVHTASVRD